MYIILYSLLAYGLLFLAYVSWSLWYTAYRSRKRYSLRPAYVTYEAHRYRAYHKGQRVSHTDSDNPSTTWSLLRKRLLKLDGVSNPISTLKSQGYQVKRHTVTQVKSVESQ